MDIWGSTKIDFLAKRKVSFTISIILAILGLVAVIAIPTGKANLGTDFAGGIAIQYRFAEAIEIEEVRELLATSGFKDANLQQFAEQNKLLVKLKRTEGNLSALTASLGAAFSDSMPENPFTIDSTREVGPTVGKKLQRDALWAVFVSMLGILVYVAWRFEFRFGVAAVIATFHDVLVVVGVLFLMNKEITLLIVTGLLTIAGYSLTDSVVVFDRIRENMRRSSKESHPELINRSINEVLRRTFVTSITTALALLALLIFGGEVLYDFALTMLMGVIVGTYSSIFIASPVLLLWGGDKKTGLAKG